MRRRRATRKLWYATFFLGLSGLTITARAGPIVSHTLATDSTGQGMDAAPATPSTPRILEPSTLPEPAASRPRTLEALEYRAGLSIDARSSGVRDRVRQGLPTQRSAESRLAWLDGPKTAPRPGAMTRAERPRRMIPEPASILLLVTGLVGVFARRHLLRQRGTE